MARKVGQGDGAIGHRHLPRTDHGVAVAQAADGAVANRHQKPFARYRRMRQDLNDGVLQTHIGQVQRR